MIVSADNHDPSYVIIDEVAGVWLALAPLRTTPTRAAAGALIFRLLDRSKPSVIGIVDERGGRYSVMGDDLVAGLVTAGVLQVAARIGSYATR